MFEDSDMDKNDLRRYVIINSEIESLQRSIGRLKNKRDDILSNRAEEKESVAMIPKRDYTCLTDGLTQEKLDMLVLELREKGKTLLIAVEEIERYLDSIDDKTMRLILREIYIKGHTQREVAEKICCSRSVIAQKLKRHWNKEKRSKISLH